MTRQEWAATALDRAAQRVEGAAKGARHDELKRWACSVAPYVRDGALTESQVTSRLVAAAATTGKGGKEARGVIAWALENAADGEAWYPDADDRDSTTIQWAGRTLQLPRTPRKDRPKLELVSEDYEPTPIAPRLRDLDLSDIELPTCVAPSIDAPMWVTMYPAMKGGTQGERLEWSWAQLCNELADPVLDVKDKAREVPMWAPHLVEGDRRPKGAVPDCHTALILDYDDQGWSIEAAQDAWGDVRHVVHTSWSHNIEKDDKGAWPRGRVVVALSRPVSPEEQAAVAEWVLQSGRGRPGASELRSVIRAYVAPCEAPGGYDHATHDPGRVVDVDELLRRLDAKRADVTALLEEHAPDPDVWGMLDVRRNKDGEVVAVNKHHRNLCIILRHDRRQKGRLGYDLFTEEGWRDGQPIDDVTNLQLLEWMGEVYNVHPTKDALRDAVRVVSHENECHQVADYLRSLTWDEVPRIHRLLTDYMGCTKSATSTMSPEDGLNEVYAKRWMISAVARALDPGCKVDTLLILKGRQGARKSSGFQALAGKAWFSDSPIPIGTNDGPQSLQGVWVQELAELDSLRRKEVTAIKAFVAAQKDRFHRRFDRFWTERPRQTVLVGTTNESSFLADATGSRRFWVRQVMRAVNIEALSRDRDQLWAEAVHRFEAGEQWWLTDGEEAKRVEDNEAYQFEYPWQEAFFEATEPFVAAGTPLRLKQVLARVFDVEVPELDMRHVTAAGRLLAAQGWSKDKKTIDGLRVWRWYPPEVVP